MAMNIPPKSNTQVQQQAAEAAPVQPGVQAAAPAPEQVQQAPEQVQQAPEQNPAQAVEASPEKDQQIVEAVAQGLEDEEISAEDIMTAVLSETLGLTPRGAQSLFRLLMTDLVEDTAEQEQEVSPQEGM